MTKKVLGTGAYATVLLAKDKLTNDFVALKIIKRDRLNEEGKNSEKSARYAID